MSIVKLNLKIRVTELSKQIENFKLTLGDERMGHSENEKKSIKKKISALQKTLETNQAILGGFN